MLVPSGGPFDIGQTERRREARIHQDYRRRGSMMSFQAELKSDPVPVATKSRS
jgi:hypothetical protein